MRWLTPKRRDYLSKFFGDLAKAIFAVGFASHFFKEFPPVLRLASWVWFLVLSVVGIWLCPQE